MRPITVQSNNVGLRAYDDNGVAYGVRPIEEFVLIDTGAILQDTSKIIDLSLLGYPVTINSIWVLATNANVGNVAINIIDKNGNDLHEITVNQDDNRNFCSTLPFLSLDDRYQLRVTPSKNVVNILFYCFRVYRIAYLGITDQ